MVVSKDYFNETGEIIPCPVYLKGVIGALMPLRVFSIICEERLDCF